MSHEFKKNRLTPVHINNITTSTITIFLNAILYEIQPASVVDIDLTEKAVHDISNEVMFPSDLTDEQGKDLLHQIRDVFSISDPDIGHRDVAHYRINLFNLNSFIQRHCRISPSSYNNC